MNRSNVHIHAVGTMCGDTLALHTPQMLGKKSHPPCLTPKCPMCVGRRGARNVSILGIDKAAMLAALYNAAVTDGDFDARSGPRADFSADMDENAARELLKGSTFFELINGRVLFIDLGGNRMDVEVYDRHNGDGAAEAVLKRLVRR